MKVFAALLGLLATASTTEAGLYYSREQHAELPSQWRGFLLDHRSLRQAGMAPANLPPTLLREQYLNESSRLAKLAQQRELNADEAADLGALFVRIGEPAKAINVLRTSQRQHPEHFRLAANLGTAWQAQGDLDAAARALRDAVRLAPVANKVFEEYHLKLVQARLSEKKNPNAVDDIFGVRYLGEPSQPEGGSLAADQRKKLPVADAAIVQQLALWLPGDGRLLWQLGEIANAHGDVRTAANILDGCVTEFGMSSPDLRERRRIYRQAADRVALLPDDEHARFRGDLKMRSMRPLARQLDESLLPAIRPDGVNALPWAVIQETTIGRSFKPAFAKYLQSLDGKSVALTGFMYPTGSDAGEVSSFLLLEYPIGCWFCETPDPANMVFVSLKKGDSSPLMKGLVKIEGVLHLNRNDPEQYVQAVRSASIGEPD